MFRGIPEWNNFLSITKNFLTQSPISAVIPRARNARGNLLALVRVFNFRTEVLANFGRLRGEIATGFIPLSLHKTFAMTAWGELYFLIINLFTRPPVNK